MTNLFTPSYTWPNPAFPFRVYFESEKLRVFIIENIPHNWNWMREYRDRFQKRDFFFVYCGWNHSEWFASQAELTLSSLNLDKSRFFYMYNSDKEMSIFNKRGFTGEVINHNAWLDENLVMKPLDLPKIYNAIYVARRSRFKRHMLAELISDLAIVAGNNHGNDLSPIPQAKYVNPQPLSPDQVCQKINESFCGLILSEEEGACFASSEYLLCGVPVVSTYSCGGRDIWYNKYNSIVCEPNPKDIAEAVSHFKNNPPEPEVIRANHIMKAQDHRLRFIRSFERVCHDNGVFGLDSYRFFYDNYYHKMRKSIRPDFDDIFPEGQDCLCKAAELTDQSE